MPNPLTPVLDELERLEKSATPGPWSYDTYNTLQDQQHREIMYIPDHPDGDTFEPQQSEERGAWYKESEANIRLVEDLRNAAPALIAAARQTERLRVALEPFARYAAVLELLAGEDRSIDSTNGWSNVDPVLGARGQVVTLGDFRRAAAALAEPAEEPHG